MDTAHTLLGIAVIAVAVLAALWGLVAYRTGRVAGPLLGHGLTLVQTVLVGQVAFGLLLLSDDRRAEDDLHYAYGTLALVAVLAPWFYAPREPRRRLLWFSLATLLAGALATRAYLTSG